MEIKRREAVIGAGLGTVVLGLVVAVWIWSERGGQAIDRAPITASSIVMLGDSITEQGPWTSAFADIQISNRGYSGFTTAQLVDIASDVALGRPSAVFVLTGTNDIRDGRPPSWTTQHLTTILDEFARTSPETTVVIQTILPRADRTDDVDATNAAVVKLANERQLEVLDLHSPFDDGTGALRSEDTVDGLHLSDAGNDRWAALLTDRFAQV